jgi:hypothetical protein
MYSLLKGAGMSVAAFQVLNPVSPEHRRGMLWFASLTHHVLSQARATGASLKRSIEFYTVYAETGDERYLGLCEDFLRDSLVANQVRHEPPGHS